MSKFVSRKLAVVAAGAAALTAAQPGSASIVITSVGSAVGSRVGTISFSPTNLSETAAIGEFTMSGYDDVTNKAVSYLTYCVDIFQQLGTGTFTQKSLADVGVSTTKTNQLNALIANTAATTTNATNSAAVQLAVWEILYEYNTNSAYSLNSGYFTASGTDISSANSLANTYVSNVSSGIWTASPSYTLGLLTSGTLQDQLYFAKVPGSQIGAVPEPTTWAMFIGGFGLIGGTMRRRRVALGFAA